MAVTTYRRPRALIIRKNPWALDNPWIVTCALCTLDGGEDVRFSASTFHDAIDLADEMFREHTE